MQNTEQFRAIFPLSVPQVQRANRCMKSAAALNEGAVTMEIWMAVCVKMTTVLHPHLTPSLSLTQK